VNSEERKDEETAATRHSASRKARGLKLLFVLMTSCGVSLFIYFVYSVGLGEIIENIQRFGLFGFGVILAIHFCRIVIRSAAWKLSVYEPYQLKLKDTVPAVIIGESLSSIIPLGILVSGTAKAVAVRGRLPLVVGLSSVATENLFYSVTTSVFLILGSLTFLRTFELDAGWVLTFDILIALIAAAVVFIILMVIRQWHFASETCEWLYRRGILAGILERGRIQVRLFENLIYGFYRRYPNRFLPICLLEAGFHFLGVLEVLFILSRLVESGATSLNAFLLETVSRLITIIFKLIPFLIGVDEAGAQFVAETVALGAGIGVTLAIIRKGRIVAWAIVGLTLIIKRGLSLRAVTQPEEGEAA
jgi:hypothetical protein